MSLHLSTGDWRDIRMYPEQGAKIIYRVEIGVQRFSKCAFYGLVFSPVPPWIALTNPICTRMQLRVVSVSQKMEISWQLTRHSRKGVHFSPCHCTSTHMYCAYVCTQIIVTYLHIPHVITLLQHRRTKLEHLITLCTDSSSSSTYEVWCEEIKNAHQGIFSIHMHKYLGGWLLGMCAQYIE